MRDSCQPDVMIRKDHAMTVKKQSTNAIDLKALVAEDCDLMKSLMKEALQEVLEAEMTEFLGAGYYERGLVTRIGKLELLFMF